MFKLIVAILPKKKIAAIMPFLKDAGIFGATMLSGKGLCTEEAWSKIGLRIGSLREVLVMLTLDMNKDKLLNILVQHGELKDPGQGIVFVMDIEKIIG